MQRKQKASQVFLSTIIQLPQWIHNKTPAHFKNRKVRLHLTELWKKMYGLMK